MARPVKDLVCPHLGDVGWRDELCATLSSRPRGREREGGHRSSVLECRVKRGGRPQVFMERVH